MNLRQVRLTINGREYSGAVEPRKPILWNGEPVRSCLLFAIQMNGADLKTVEGIAPNATELHPLQEKFWELHGLQCGFCTPGILLTAEALLKEIPNPSELEIREWLSGNLCRCTGYQNIVTAIKETANAVNNAKS